MKLARVSDETRFCIKYDLRTTDKTTKQLANIYKVSMRTVRQLYQEVLAEPKRKMPETRPAIEPNHPHLTAGRAYASRRIV